MARRTRRARAAEIRAHLDALGAAEVGEAVFSELCTRFAPLKPETLRKHLRECGLPLAPAVEGVRQESFDALDRTLSALASEYGATSDRERRRMLRRLVIAAKDHARFAARRSKDAAKQRDKEEMVQWMIVWLENPGVFAQWLRLRRAALAGGSAQ